jgi:hypothetical protein
VGPRVLPLPVLPSLLTSGAQDPLSHRAMLVSPLLSLLWAGEWGGEQGPGGEGWAQLTLGSPQGP